MSPHDNTNHPRADSRDPRGLPVGDRLIALGWDERWSALATGIPHPPELALRPGRVARVNRGRIRILTHSDDLYATLHGARTPTGSAEPVTGDWIMLDERGDLAAVLPRRTALTRGAGRRDARAQVLAANVDLVLVMVSLDAPPNRARVDRMLAVAWESGAQPVVVLSKADLCRTAQTERDEVAEQAPGVPVHLVSVRDGRGLNEIAGLLAPGRTVVLLGVSGVGKSSLVNALAGTDLLAVGDTRSDGRGRHTTTSRDLVVLPGMGVLIDTPGLRGVQLWDSAEGLERTFADVEDLAGQCRFTDCGHDNEPGCAVTAAIADGRLDRARLASYRKLQREVDWLRSRYDARLRAEQRRRWRNIAQTMRDRGRP
ncbi:MAG TPA: ribosome small subunit-dependent GTPase A [Mycobacteriales bacterium]|nr:ribosome small subunit-dependent GTPase A [Mycobacteriales bacterium]